MNSMLPVFCMESTPPLFFKNVLNLALCLFMKVMKKSSKNPFCQILCYCESLVVLHGVKTHGHAAAPKNEIKSYGIDRAATCIWLVES